MNENLRGSPGGTDPLEKSLRELPRDLPPEGLDVFICSALDDLPVPKRPLWRRVAVWMENPAVVLGYRLATVVLLVGILAGVWTLVAVRRGGSSRTAPDIPGPALASHKGSPGAGRKTGVTFVFHAPEAGSVAVVGSFNDWDPGRYPMTRGADGNWTVRVDLPPGQYEYQFVVDGSRFVPDPNATEQRDDGIGGANAVLRL